MKTLFFIILFFSASYSQNNYLSLDYNLSLDSKIYSQYSAYTLTYHLSLLNDRVHLGPFLKYYNNNVGFASVKLPYTGTGPKDNGIAYGISLNIYPLDSSLLGTTKFLPYLAFNVGKYGGYFYESSKGSSYSIGKANEKYSTSYGLGINYVERIFGFYVVLLYEFRTVEIKKSEHTFSGPAVISYFNTNLSSPILKLGFRIRL